MKGTTTKIILALLFCAGLTLAKEEQCLDLQNKYSESYKWWIQNRGRSVGETSPAQYKVAEVDLLAVKLNGCNTETLPLIKPVPDFVQPTPAQLTCVNLAEHYIGTRDDWAMSYHRKYSAVALTYLQMQVKGCDYLALPSIYPVPQMPDLTLSCDELRDTYAADYSTWANHENFQIDRAYFSAAVDLLGLTLKSCDLTGLEMLSPVPDFMNQNKNTLGVSILTRKTHHKLTRNK